MNNQESLQDQSFDINELAQSIRKHDWSDIAQAQLPFNAIYQIQIPNPQTKHFYLLLRYVLENQQISQRSFGLSTWALKLKTNNYYALMLRKDYVLYNKQTVHTNKFFEHELQFVNNLLQDNCKEYHIWTYKKDLLKHMFNQQQSTQQIIQLKQKVYSQETKLIFEMLNDDCRNYHAWDYRFWIVTYFNQIQKQLQWTQQILFQNKNHIKNQQLLNMLKEQGFNAQQRQIDWSMINSLWSHRFNLHKYKRQSNQLYKTQSNQSEDFNFIQYLNFISVQTQKVLNLIINDKRNNQCAWNYLSGFLSELINLNNIQIKLELHQNRIYSIFTSILNRLFKWEIVQTNSLIQNIINYINTNNQNNKVICCLNRFQLAFIKKTIILLSRSKYIQLQDKINQICLKIVYQLKQIDPTRLKYYDYLERELNPNKNEPIIYK